MIDTDTHTKTGMLGLMRGFVERKIEVSVFIADYQRLWKAWRDLNDFADLDGESAGVFGRAFTAADCYRAPGSTYTSIADIDEDRLRAEIKELLETLKTGTSRAADRYK
jgi:hypothetical protein